MRIKQSWLIFVINQFDVFVQTLHESAPLCVVARRRSGFGSTRTRGILNYEQTMIHKFWNRKKAARKNVEIKQNARCVFRIFRRVFFRFNISFCSVQLFMILITNCVPGDGDTYGMRYTYREVSS